MFVVLVDAHQYRFDSDYLLSSLFFVTDIELLYHIFDTVVQYCKQVMTPTKKNSRCRTNADRRKTIRKKKTTGEYQMQTRPQPLSILDSKCKYLSRMLGLVVEIERRWASVSFFYLCCAEDIYYYSACTSSCFTRPRPYTHMSPGIFHSCFLIRP